MRRILLPLQHARAKKIKGSQEPLPFRMRFLRFAQHRNGNVRDCVRIQDDADLVISNLL